MSNNIDKMIGDQIEVEAAQFIEELRGLESKMPKTMGLVIGFVFPVLDEEGEIHMGHGYILGGEGSLEAMAGICSDEELDKSGFLRRVAMKAMEMAEARKMEKKHG